MADDMQFPRDVDDRESQARRSSLLLDLPSGRLSRRQVLQRAAVLGLSAPVVASLLAACRNDDEPEPTPVVGDEPDDGEESDDGEEPDDGEEVLAPGTLRDVPRNRTVIAVGGGGTDTQIDDYDNASPYLLGGTFQRHTGLFYEPLYFISYGPKIEYPWLAENYEFNEDFTELTYILRSGITWSDGEPFTAEDVAFTLNTLRDLGPEIRWGSEVQFFLEEARVIDDSTVTLKFKQPAPRFHILMSYTGDTNIMIVPKHIFEGEDWTEFTHVDLEKGWPVTTSPWRMVYSDPSQVILDRVSSCDEWWACRTGFQALPKVERLMYLPWHGESQAAQAIIQDDADVTWNLWPEVHKQIYDNHPNARSWSGREEPFGILVWFPTGLALNNKDRHFSKPEVRWAINHFIDRETTLEFALDGAGSDSKVPWPAYEGSLTWYTEQISDLLEQYPSGVYDPERGEELLTEAGYSRDGEGIWVDSDGDRITCEILGSPGYYSRIGNALVPQLTRHGIEATYAEPPDRTTLITQAEYTGAVQGHAGSQEDPYLTLRMYTTDDPFNYYHWSNKEFDAIVDEMGVTSPEDTDTMVELTRQAMEIWLRELPEPQLLQWHNRWVVNETYWTGWPSEDDPHMHGMFVHPGFAVTLTRLEPTE